MSATDLERIEEQLKTIRELVERKISLPRELFTIGEAAERLGVKMTKMRALVKARVVGTVPFGDSDMVPRSEIERLSFYEPPKALPPKTARLAASLSKLRHPEPGAREAALRVRNAKRPRPAQDLESLEEIIKASNKKRRR